MVDADLSREKLFQCKIDGQTKPFVDQNLQLQIPGVEVSNPVSHPHQTYPHSSIPFPFNEAELHQAMAEAEQSHQAWQKMAEKLKTAMIDGMK